MRNWKSIVVKVGSNTICKPNGKLNLRLLDILVRTLSDLKSDDMNVVLVSSGAIAVGFNKIGLCEKPKDIPTKQACAAIGQGELMYIYEKFFTDYGHNTAQILLTKDVFDDPERRNNVVNTFKSLFKMGIVPIVNENDTVAYDEIVIGDNDTLSAIVASLIEADGLVIFSDIDGLYDKDPHLYKDAKLIEKVTNINEDIIAMATGSTSNVGTGGMMTKIQAAQIANDHNIETIIANGSNPRVLYDILDNKSVGTSFIKE
ncbi:MAG: glutamate 5-kinase [Erysipelotrichaceae bacterium]|nr:glutamate 5-kinase [Erysipelotrichaceae bacterium]